MNNELSINVKIIGTVKSDLEKETRGEASADLVSEIVLDEKYTDAVDSLDDFSHIIVVYWISSVKESGPMKIHPHRNPENPICGILATLAPDRPNQVGLCVARLLERNGNILKVKGLYSGNGDPVMDIRPYVPGMFSFPEAKIVSKLA